MNRGPAPGTGQGFNFKGGLADIYGADLARVAAENATRVPCRYCGVPCLPATLARHEGLHED